MGNFNKFDKFPLMECVQRSDNVERANFEPGAEEILKLFWRRRNEREARIYLLLLPNILNAYYSYTYYSEYFSLSARQTTNYQETTDTPTELSAMDTDADTESFTQDVNNMRKETKNCSPESQVEQGASLGNGEIDNEYEEGTKNSLPKTSGAYTEAEAEEATKVSDET
ncbi:hypothetical protein EVAR_54300_1 [Eumeta japonica]|uniref:Uncharacterized protein n=1 Tax=Eumeta variegata TaxID=151549 RepID=A0A4C1Z165_EUMVA|nr:hypothetical protein EVAR_54300_1 [Eumeta japonica]